MVKRRQEENPPLELPPAKLFLDDLEEVIRLFTEAARREQVLTGNDSRQVSFRIGVWECDSLADLKEFGRTRRKEYFHLRLHDANGSSIGEIISTGVALHGAVPIIFHYRAHGRFMAGCAP